MEQKILFKSFTDENYSGNGKIVTDNFTYEGDILSGKMTGNGTKKFNDGSVVSGNFINGILNGYSIFRYGNNSISGNFINGAPDGELIKKTTSETRILIYKNGKFLTYKGAVKTIYLYSEFQNTHRNEKHINYYSNELDGVGIYAFDYFGNELLNEETYITPETLIDLKKHLDEASKIYEWSNEINNLSSEYFDMNIEFNSDFYTNKKTTLYSKSRRFKTDVLQRLLDSLLNDIPKDELSELSHFKTIRSKQYQDKSKELDTLIGLSEEIFGKDIGIFNNKNLKCYAKLLKKVNDELDKIYKNMNDDELENEIDWWANGGNWR